MASIGFDIPEDIRAVRDGIEKFVRAEVISRHERHGNLLADPRRLFQADGRICDEALQLMREVRMASAAVPMLFQPKVIDGEHHIDGAIASATNADVFVDGRLDVAEFEQLMKALDALEPGESAAIGFKAIDTDGSGLLEFDEFARWFSQR